MLDFFEYFLIEKLENFFSAPEHTYGSGAFRSYTNRLGYAIFNEYPITGVGIGMSQYYMHIYDPQMGIINYGETLIPGMFPQNVFSITFAELGLFGGICLILFCIINWIKAWKYRNKNSLCLYMFAGVSFNILSLFSQSPAYSIFLWAFIALSAGYYKYLRKQKHDTKNHTLLLA